MYICIYICISISISIMYLYRQYEIEEDITIVMGMKNLGNHVQLIRHNCFT